MVFSTVILYLSLMACAVGLGLVIHKYDLYLREPLRLILVAVGLGAAAMWLATLGQVEVIRMFVQAGRMISDPVLALLAGFTEELGKLGVVIVIAVGMRRAFNEPLDGLVYGSFAGLGAALIESVWVVSGESGLVSLPPQEPVRLAGHVIMGGIGGFGAGLLPMRSRFAAAAIIASLTGAVVLHTLWDMIAFAAANHYQRFATVRPVHSAAAVAVMLAGMVAYRWLVGVGARLTRAHLQVCDVATRRCPPF